jgi:hypothetical protein
MIDLFSRRVVDWSATTAQPAFAMVGVRFSVPLSFVAIRGQPNNLLCTQFRRGPIP